MVLSYQLAKQAMPRWFRALLLLLAAPCRLLFRRGGEQATGLKLCISMHRCASSQRRMLKRFPISDKYKDHVLGQHKNEECILDKETAPNGNNSFSWLFGKSITPESVTYHIPSLPKNIYLDLEGEQTTSSTQLVQPYCPCSKGRQSKAAVRTSLWHRGHAVYRQQALHS